MISALLNLPLANLVLSFRQSDFQGKIIVLVLFVGSIFAWSIMVTKMRAVKQARLVNQRFLAAFRREAHPAALFLKRQQFEGSPLYSVYEKTLKAVGGMFESRAGAEDLFMGAVGTNANARCLSDVQVGYIRNVAERTVTDEAMLLENNMGLLATAVTTAPFLGLLGTVWGVLDAFGGISLQGTAVLSAVMPGISGALLTTVVGLLVALPSAIGYNVLTDRIRKLAVGADHFGQELMTAIERHYRQA